MKCASLVHTTDGRCENHKPGIVLCRGTLGGGWGCSPTETMKCGGGRQAVFIKKTIIKKLWDAHQCFPLFLVLKTEKGNTSLVTGDAWVYAI